MIRVGEEVGIRGGAPLCPGVWRTLLERGATTATRGELEGAVATDLVQCLLQRDGGEALPILSSLVDAVSDRDRGLLDDLERLIRRKRRAAGRPGSR